MKITTAVILAAGKGRRMKVLGETIPKGFIRLGQKPIIEESVTKLIQCSISRIIIVTGHQAQYYESLKKVYPKHIITVHNPEYAKSGNLYSLYCAKDLICDDFLLLESDLIYEQRALKTVLTFPKANTALLSGFTHATDEVYVKTSGRHIVALSKNKSELGSNITGEFIGICKISVALFQQLLKTAAQLFKESLHRDYETDGLVAVAKKSPIFYTLINDLLWAEIDTETHLLRAKQSIYPAIAEKDSVKK
ncbi:MAG: phosphocholine cytidylyltransferase family protein [Sinomicrobium sp.]|nr:phosphocholine cytidylyltransferase family protein [Sinomicrobium sp.]